MTFPPCSDPPSTPNDLPQTPHDEYDDNINMKTKNTTNEGGSKLKSEIWKHFQKLNQWRRQGPVQIL